MLIESLSLAKLQTLYARTKALLLLTAMAMLGCVLHTKAYASDNTEFANEPGPDSFVLPRIVGGQAVRDNRFEFMAALFQDRLGDGGFSLSCGATIISNRWVLTAAHCLFDPSGRVRIPAQNLGIYFGSNDLNSPDGNFVPVRRTIVHPDYDILTSRADIGLIELLGDYSGSTPFLPVAGSTIPVTDEMSTVIGWGALFESGPLTSILREVDLPIVSNAACYPYYQRSFGSSSNFCAGGATEGGFDSCQGDSGGPVIVTRQNRQVIAGIVSYGDGCARKSVPGVYTRVTSYSDWVAAFVPEAGYLFDQSQSENTAQRVSFLPNGRTFEGTLRQGEVALFEVSGAERIELRSRTGDADLFVVDGMSLRSLETIDRDSVSCVSQLGTPFDSCTLVDQNQRTYASVYGFTDTEFSIVSRSADDAEIVVSPQTPPIAPDLDELMFEPIVIAETPAEPAEIIVNNETQGAQVANENSNSNVPPENDLSAETVTPPGSVTVPIVTTQEISNEPSIASGGSSGSGGIGALFFPFWLALSFSLLTRWRQRRPIGAQY